ncbi:MAG: hypothetical protein K2M36_04105 [Clostridia bacterium]|nr:hypothetical protein [Clostridia bacterium]
MNRIFLYGSGKQKEALIDKIFSDILERHAEGSDSRKRLEYELEIIRQTGNEECIACFIDEIRDARKNSLWLTGQSGCTYFLNGNYYIDGAANCSYLLYRAGITKVNSLKLNIPFERFINPLLPNKAPIFGISVAPKQKYENNGETLDEKMMRYVAERSALFTDDIFKPRLIPIAWENAEKQIRAKRQPVADILTETNGQLIWQEQVMVLLHLLGGYSYAEADCIRRDLVKRRLDISQMLELRDTFVNGAVKLGYTKEDADELFEYLLKQHNFCYVKAHTAAVVLNGDCATNID